jgi:hypothetical protein
MAISIGQVREAHRRIGRASASPVQITQHPRKFGRRRDRKPLGPMHGSRSVKNIDLHNQPSSVHAIVPITTGQVCRGPRTKKLVRHAGSIAPRTAMTRPDARGGAPRWSRRHCRPVGRSGTRRFEDPLDSHGPARSPILAGRETCAPIVRSPRSNSNLVPEASDCCDPAEENADAGDHGPGFGAGNLGCGDDVDHPFAEIGDRLKRLVAAVHAVGERCRSLGNAKARTALRRSSLCEQPIRCGVGAERTRTFHSLFVMSLAWRSPSRRYCSRVNSVEDVSLPSSNRK